MDLELATISAGNGGLPAIRDLALLRGKRFGCMMNTPNFAEPVYRDFAHKNAGVLVNENSLKWKVAQPSEGEWDFAAFDAALALATEMNVPIEAKLMAMWHKVDNPPDNPSSNGPAWLISKLQNDPASWEATMESFIATLGARYDENPLVTRMWAWNELTSDPTDEVPVPSPPLRETSFWVEASGLSATETAIIVGQMARQYWPTTALTIGEGLVEMGDAQSDTKFTAWFALVEALANAGVLDRVSMQGHIDVENRRYGNASSSVTFDENKLRSRFRALKDLGLRVDIGEFDVGSYWTNLPDTVAYRTAEVTRRFVDAWLEEDAGDHFVVFGQRCETSWRYHADTQETTPQFPLPWSGATFIPNQMERALRGSFS